MKTIETYVRQIETVNSRMMLESFFQQICAGGAHQWAGLVIFKSVSPSSKDMEICGMIPEALHGQIEDECSHRMETGIPRLKPYVQSENRRGMMLYVPFNTSSSEHGYLVLDCVHREPSEERYLAEKLGWFWSIIVPYLYQAYLRIESKPVSNITKRELECIRWASEGKTSWEISQILDISERTANFHLANYIEKTGSVNRQQAIVKCLLSGHLLFTDNL